jgi:hypothetical protein
LFISSSIPPQIADSPSVGNAADDVVNPHSYHIVKHKQSLISATLPLSSAVYDPATHSVTLTLAHRLKKTPFVTISDAQLEQGMNAVGMNTPTPSELLPAISPITDATGNPIAGFSGPASQEGHFYITVGVSKAGKRLARESNAPLNIAPPVA